MGIHGFQKMPPLLAEWVSRNRWENVRRLALYQDKNKFRGFSEPCITNEPSVNIQEVLLIAFLLERLRDEVLVISFFLSVTVTVWSTFPDVKVRNGEEVKN